MITTDESIDFFVEETIDTYEIEDILFGNDRIALSEKTEKRIGNCFDFLKQFASDKVIYGINTGFGPMAQYRIEDKSHSELQYNIIRSHAAGAGKPLPNRYVKAAMLARLGTFVQAKSGVHLDLVQLLVEFINRGIYPLVPEHGGVGASGDLVQLAHIALTLIGEGKVHYKGEWINTKEALKAEKLKPFKIRLREGLAMVNGTSVMTGIGLVNYYYARKIMNWSIIASVLINEIASSYDDFMSMKLTMSKRHAGQRVVAEKMRELSVGSKCLRKRKNELYNGKQKDAKTFEQKLQPYYSLRCVPQILGPVFDQISHTGEVLTDELNSVCDNPIIDYKVKNVYHGGNFHGDYVSFEMDKLKIAITKMTMLMERQFNYLCHDRINEILPPFVNMGTLGVNYGLQGMQFTATSTTAESQTLSNPMSIHSIPNNNDNQDIVSMGTNSALMAKTVIENAFQVAAIHFIGLVQAVDCLEIQDKLAPETKKHYDQIRQIVPVFSGDKPKYAEIEMVKQFIANN
ncbi:MAG: aromatic amino acid ammonia-lyase [Lentimicrobiaceae bacterium]|nr:aromatic amino acid ammonia-lyase [Lentimicrobiaceae bacterium]